MHAMAGMFGGCATPLRCRARARVLSPLGASEDGGLARRCALQHMASCLLFGIMEATLVGALFLLGAFFVT